MPDPTYSPWPNDQTPTEDDLNAALAAEGLEPHWWGNGPFERYSPHDHSYHKVLFCLFGSITFTIDPGGQRFTLEPGDRLELPPFTTHSAVVGPRGCRCAEGWRSA
jgi:hypothetical protein